MDILTENFASLSPTLIFDIGVVLFILMLVAQNLRWPFLKFLSLVFFSALAIVSLAIAGYLFSVGMKAGWKSDGPGMLGVMIIILFLGPVGLVSGRLALRSLVALKVDPRESKPATAAQQAALKTMLNQVVVYGKYRLKLSSLIWAVGLVLYLIVRIMS